MVMIKFIKGYECVGVRTTTVYISRTKGYEFKISEVETEIEYRSVEDMIRIANTMVERGMR